MSSEWTVVTGNKRNVKQPISTCNMTRADKTTLQIKEVRPSKEEQINQAFDKREQWEQRRQKKIAEYDAEFPLLPRSKDSVPEATKIAYIDAKIAARKEANHKAYLEREARRQEKAKRAAEKAKREAELYEIAEKEHVRDMIEKWGTHRWYRCVAYTEDDCDTAQKLRDEEEENEWRREQYERELELEWEKKEEIRKAEREKYIEEQTANMTEEQKRRWIFDFEYEEKLESDYAYQAQGEDWYRAYTKIEKEDQERLDRWNAKHGKK